MDALNGWDCNEGTCACRYCGQTKPCTQFPTARTPRGHTLRCRECQAALTRSPDYTPPVIIACAWCGTKFRQKRDRAKFCSMACQYASRRKPELCRVYYIECQTCTELFTSSNALRKYCSERCSYIYQYHRDYPGVEPRPFECIDCGQSFIQRHGNNPRCDICRGQRKGAIKSAGSARRRSRERSNGPWEPVSRQYIFERDHWKCYLCGQSVDQSAPVIDPLYPTLDHVMPLALGGTHTADNLRLACRACNVSKGANFLVEPPQRPTATPPTGKISRNSQAR